MAAKREMLNPMWPLVIYLNCEIVLCCPSFPPICEVSVREQVYRKTDGQVPPLELFSGKAHTPTFLIRVHKEACAPPHQQGCTSEKLRGENAINLKGKYKREFMSSINN